MEHEQLMARAELVGLDKEWVSKILIAFGQDVLDMAISLIQNGFSKEWVVDLVTRLGQDLAKLLAPSALLRAPMPIIEGEQVTSFDEANIDLVKTLIEQLMPLLKPYWPQLIQMLLSLLLKK